MGLAEKRAFRNFLARMFHEFLSRDHEDGRATWQPQGVGSEAYLNGTSQEQKPEDAKENDQHLRDFLRDHRETVEKLQEDIYNLPSDDKKILIESMVDGKMRVSSGEKKGWAAVPFRMPFNRLILDRFINDGKLGSSSKNGRDHSDQQRGRTPGG